MITIDKILFAFFVFILVGKSAGLLYFLHKWLRSKKLVKSLEETLVQNGKAIDFLTSQNRLLSYEVDKAKDITKAFYPKKEPLADPRFDVFGISVPSNKISGDYYDIFSTPSGNIYFGIGDVTGHGLSSSILSLIVSRRVRTFIELGIKDIPAILESCNNEIAYEASKYMSLLMGKICLDNNIELYGKQEAVVICRSDRLETINDQSGFILGNSSFNINSIPKHMVTMESEDFMIMYTDGVTELENSVGETIGISGILAYIQPNVSLFRSLKASQICQEIVDFLAMWGADNIEDDITILVIKRT